jgi:hypothetical protein
MRLILPILWKFDELMSKAHDIEYDGFQVASSNRKSHVIENVNG